MEIQHIGRLLRIAEHALLQRIQKDQQMMDLTTSQSYVLRYLSLRHINKEEPIYPKDVERHFGVRHSSVSGILSRLEAKGFLTFSENPTDRRCKQIVITEKALRLQAHIDESILATEQTILHGMNDEEQKQFTRLLRMAAENLGGNTEEHIVPQLNEEELKA